MQLQTLTLINKHEENSHKSVQWNLFMCTRELTHAASTVQYIREQPLKHYMTHTTFDMQHWPQFNTVHFINTAENIRIKMW